MSGLNSHWFSMTTTRRTKPMTQTTERFGSTRDFPSNRSVSGVWRRGFIPASHEWRAGLRHLSVEQILSLHQSIVGHLSDAGVRNLSALESAVSRPAATFDGEDLHPTLEAKAAALVSSLILGGPFVDGGRETALIACECFL